MIFNVLTKKMIVLFNKQLDMNPTFNTIRLSSPYFRRNAWLKRQHYYNAIIEKSNNLVKQFRKYINESPYLRSADYYFKKHNLYTKTQIISYLKNDIKLGNNSKIRERIINAPTDEEALKIFHQGPKYYKKINLVLDFKAWNYLYFVGNIPYSPDFEMKAVIKDVQQDLYDNKLAKEFKSE